MPLTEVSIDSQDWGTPVYGIINAENYFWSPLTFDSKKKAEEFVNDRLGYGAITRNKMTIVPVHTIVKTAFDKSPARRVSYISDEVRRPKVYAAAREQFNSVDALIKDDIEGALEWAKETMTAHEGDGHHFSIIYEDGFKCCFCKPSWNADHCSQAMPSAAEAVVMAVCEYLNGV